MKTTTNPLDTIHALQQGELVVMKTDTIYGILASAKIPRAVEKLYTVRRRDPRKSCIILVSRVDDICNLTGDHKATYEKLYKERPTTIVVPAPDDYLPHLHRQNSTLAFRCVRQPELVQIIDKVGPLLAPSANPEGHEPAQGIDQAIAYFGEHVAVYVDGGPVARNLPSKIIAINDDDEIEIIRD